MNRENHDTPESPATAAQRRAQVEGPVAGPRPPGQLTLAEALLLLELRRQGYELVQDWCIGPRGAYPHRRVIRPRRGG